MAGMLKVARRRQDLSTYFVLGILGPLRKKNNPGSVLYNVTASPESLPAFPKTAVI